MKRIAMFFTVFCIILCGMLPVSAAASSSYVYDTEGKAKSVPKPYQTVDCVDGEFAGKRLNSPQDLFVAGDQTVYILDSGNNRIVRLNGDMTFKEEIFLTKNGERIEFSEAKGIFVGDGSLIYVADKGAQVVYVTSADGSVTGEITSPPKDQVDDDFEYTPVSVAVDTAGIIYVISSGSYSGALQYDADYNFLGFYGSEKVNVTAKVLFNEFWKKVLSEEAASGLTRNVPTSVIALDIDENNFVYTLRGGSSDNQSGQIRKLNTLGANVLLDDNGAVGTYGDTDTYFDSGKNLTVSSTLTDLVVDNSGFITVIDRTYNRLFQYDQSANMLYAFGGSEDIFGNFASPVAVEALDDKLLVLDDTRNSITVLQPTEFAANVRKALLLTDDGRYGDAAVYWEKVLAFDCYYPLANNGMGVVCEEQGNVDEAMTYYRIADNKEGYSSAFSVKRDEWIKSHFAFLLSAVVVAMLVAVVLVNYFERHKKNRYNQNISRLMYPKYCLAHPFRAYFEMKQERKGSLLIANIVLSAFFLLSVINERLTAFHFSSADDEGFNVFTVLVNTVGIFVLFVLCNWAVSTLADGEGTFGEIWIFTAYALIPYCISLAALTGISHVLCLDENAFWTVFRVIAVVWAALHIFSAVKEAHRYTVKKTITVMAVTAVGMYMMLLIITLGYSLFTQLLNFLATVYSEYRLR